MKSPIIVLAPVPTATETISLSRSDGNVGDASFAITSSFDLTAPGPDLTSPPTPQPTALAIWGVGAGLAGAAALRRRKPHGRWSEENRSAISRVIAGKR